MKSAPKKVLPLPTPSELTILQILWEKGPLNVRQVQSFMAEDTGYTTVLKLMQIMHEKGLVLRDESQKTHIYSATHPAEKTQRTLIRQLVDRAFSGSVQNLVCQALSSRKATRKELEEIKLLVANLEKQMTKNDRTD